MANHPVPFDEIERLEELTSLAVLDTPPDPAYDLVTSCASKVFEMPIVLISLIDKDRQWFKSCIGLDARETARDSAFCAHAIMRDDVLCVPDASLDDRFAQNPLVIGPPYIRFYAGAPLVTQHGFRLGTLCIISPVVRPALSDREKDLLKSFAAIIVNQLERGRSCASANEEEKSFLREARASAERAAEAKSGFLAMVSHELKTPLNIIMGFSDLIRKETFGPVGNPSYREYATSIHESGEHLQTMISTILDFAAADRGDIKLKETEVSVGDVVDKCLRLLGDKARRFEVIAGARPMYTAPLLLADRQHLTQMLLNVIGNAIKFNRPSGTVVVGIDEGIDGALSISVVDSGIGISPETIDMLELPFSQIDTRLARQHEGIGLGLAITRRLIEAHGGTLSVQSRTGEGSRVTLNFPAHRTVAAKRGDRQLLRTASGR